jgi:hypothetical protein
MSLLELKQHLMQSKITTLGNLAQYFHCDDPELLRSMLRHWVRKGCLRQFTKTPACGTRCAQCSDLDYEIYEWI